MKIFKFIPLFCMLGFTSCTILPTEDPVTSLVSREGGKLHLDGLWPLADEGNYVQQLSIKLENGQSHQFLVYLNLGATHVTAMGVHDVFGRLYEITLKPEKLEVTTVDADRLMFKPEDILMDFLLSHFPLEKLANISEDFEIQESPDGNREITMNGEVIRHISREGPLSSLMWKKITIKNPQIKYTLVVKTKVSK